MPSDTNKVLQAEINYSKRTTKGKKGQINIDKGINGQHNLVQF